MNRLRRSRKTRKKAPPKHNLKRKRRTLPPPRCPVHGTPMLVGHVSGARQYRYCKVRGCREGISTFRVKRSPPPPLPAEPVCDCQRNSSPPSQGAIGWDSNAEHASRSPAAFSPPSQGGARGGPEGPIILPLHLAGTHNEFDFFPEYFI